YIAETGTLPPGASLGAGMRLPQGAYRNAQAFKGKATPGLINLNTATPEVMRSLPEWAGLIPEDYRLRGFPTQTQDASQFSRSTTYTPEAVVQYRDRLGAGPDDLFPTYAVNTLITTSSVMQPNRAGAAGYGLYPELSSIVGRLAELRQSRGLA